MNMPAAVQRLGMAINDSRRELLSQRNKLALTLSRSQEVAQGKSQNRKAELRQAIRDLSVQAIATALGGSVLAGLGLLVGLIPREPEVIWPVALLSATLIAATCFTISSAVVPPVTRADVEILRKITVVDAAIALMDSESEVSDSARKQSGG